MSKPFQKRQDEIDDDPEYLRIFNYWRMYDLGATVFALLGLGCALVNYEVDIGNRDLIIYDVSIITKNYSNALDTDRFKDG